MIHIKSEAEIEQMRAAGKLVSDTFKMLQEYAVAGTATEKLDKLAHDFICDHGGTPSCLNYCGYPKTICTSVNEQVVHGIPGKYVLRDGDIVSCDIVAELSGWHGDATRTFLIGEVEPRVRDLVEVSRECFFEGLKFAKPGYRVSDISKAIQACAESHGYGVVEEYIGHGIGRQMHESPDIPNFYDPRRGKGARLLKGMVFAVEPMITLGSPRVRVLSDGWTAVTADGLASAHYENTVAITDGEPLILTMPVEE
ncbi:MAG: type I methionyl aminopeptidase [Clostridia bacterium]|nr:type I methionyl aminopeptidase [Clostridia bacterium]